VTTSAPPNQSAPTIAVIGGGFSGASVAYHLASHFARILVFEPRSALGQGLAYDTHDPVFRINVPAAKMSFVPGDDAHFVDWVTRNNALVDDPEATDRGRAFPRREIFGRYVEAQIRPFLSNGRVKHIAEAALNITRRAGKWEVISESGASYLADILVLATTHPPPSVPDAFESLRNNDRLIADSAQPGALDSIKETSDILIVGTGLTMADVVASLSARGHRGHITAVSRRGLLPRPHDPKQSDPIGNFSGRELTALSLLRDVRVAIREASDTGISWQAVIDAVRAQAQGFWPTLGLIEQRRILRHLRPFWDVHRFRVAPQVGRVIENRQKDGSLHVEAGHVVGAVRRDDQLLVTLKLRRRQATTVKANFVVITTGPAHGTVISTSPHLASLNRAGLIAPDALGLGLACDRRGRALNAAGKAVSRLYIAGPLARGTFGELMGLPQVSEYAAFVADEIKREHALSGVGASL
jgi:uncharacterized NAD(P)/FAD-binding protein YdhS